MEQEVEEQSKLNNYFSIIKKLFKKNIHEEEQHIGQQFLQNTQEQEQEQEQEQNQEQD